MGDDTKKYLEQPKKKDEQREGIYFGRPNGVANIILEFTRLLFQSSIATKFRNRGK